MTSPFEHTIFRVSFYKIVPDSTGHCHDCCQGAMEVDAGGQDDAIRIASRRFAELNQVPVWSLRADSVKAEHLAGRRRVSSSVWSNSLRSA